MAADIKEARKRRHKRIRKIVSGTPERPRLSVYRSLNHIYAQVIDDSNGRTLAAACSMDKGLEGQKGHKGNVVTAKKIGELIAKKILEKGVSKVVFDRSGYIYHGRIKALADGAREAGLEF
ncbi:MAG: 50S ribosomal protein L18 [Nitrospirota bacterium]